MPRKPIIHQSAVNAVVRNLTPEEIELANILADVENKELFDDEKEILRDMLKIELEYLPETSPVYADAQRILGYERPKKNNKD